MPSLRVALLFLIYPVMVKLFSGFKYTLGMQLPATKNRRILPHADITIT